MNQFEIAGAFDRALKYGKARKTVGAARGWEPWQRWEDRYVAYMVEHPPGPPNYSVASLAKHLKRTENAILCRIEKRYGAEMRAHFTAFASQYHNGCPKPDLDYPNRALAELLGQCDAYSLDGIIMDMKMNDKSDTKIFYDADHRSDAKIFYDAVSDISLIKNTRTYLNPARIAYRVTKTEYHAMRRHLEHQHGRPIVSLSILGVDVMPTMPECEPVIKDYGSSG